MTWLMELYFRIITPREHEDRGATMVEYGLMVALIAIVVLTAVTPVGTKLANLFTDVASHL